MTTDPLRRILRPRPPAFAILHRPDAAGPDQVDVLVGEVSTPATLADVPLPEPATTGTEERYGTLAIVPYRQITERGYAAVEDAAPLVAMTVTEQARLPVAELLARVPDVPLRLSDGHFDVADDTYADTVRKVIDTEIGNGAGSNFVIKRSYVADILDYTPHSALALFGRLLRQESGAYWTFIVHIGDRTFVGASPERHVSLRDGVAVMNPISGTYRYPPSGPTLRGVLDFLEDRKEIDELYMVVDEELKMMARICDSGAQVVGPHLKQMAHLAHTEYFIRGHSDHDPREIIRETMFAPTVTGSPLENACRVIRRYEPHGRGYYSGAVALMGRDAEGAPTLDSSILIRTAEMEASGRLRIGVGATLVRHSDPAGEVAETRAKAGALLAALGAGRARQMEDEPQVRAALTNRNEHIAGFWLTEESARRRPSTALAGRRALVVDAEDAFTTMLAHQLRSLGLSVTVRRFDETYDLHAYDVVVMGPGPGDPRDLDDPRMAALRSAIEQLLRTRRPFLAVCLSHQLLSLRLGLELVRRDVPNQGVQRRIDLFGAAERVGFYNTFEARSRDGELTHPEAGSVTVSRDPVTGGVYALRGPRFASLQFHAESVLTQDGVRILGSLVGDVLNEPAPRTAGTEAASAIGRR
ncbi:MAG TPA: anthranilate synthase family protein [Streptosporangiaceae bacterium]|nr:anthranilate synthase family protein [Streptosporangiaceae bacterium]